MNKSELQDKLNFILNSTGETSQWKSGYKKGVWDSLMLARHLDDCIVDENDAYLIMRGISKLPDKTFDSYWDSLKGTNNISDNFNLDHEATELDLERFKDELLKCGYTVGKIKPLVVPKFVADWYEDKKQLLEFEIFSLTVSIYDKSESNAELNEMEVWFNNPKNKGYEVLTHMKYGYEVEKLVLWEIPLTNLRTSDGKEQFVSFDPKENTFFASSKNRFIKQSYTQVEIDTLAIPYKNNKRKVQGEN